MNSRTVLLNEAYKEARSLSTKNRHEPEKSSLNLSFEIGDFDYSYLKSHLGRIEKSFEHLAEQKTLRTSQPRILDIGTGFFYHSAIKDLFPDCDLQFTTDGMDVERSRLSSQDSFFDLVIIWEVVEHFYSDPMFAMWEINRVLKPGGLLFLTTPNVISWVSVLKTLLGHSPAFYDKYSVQPSGRRHVHEHTPDSIGRLLYAAGFNPRVWTENVYFERIGDLAYRYFEEAGVSMDYRGDSIFAIGTKETVPRERYPAFLYDSPDSENAS